ncbi:MAG: amidohydrolase family protein [Aminivibrio sp.]|nr:amidohydrolase family protein [Synergistaceae bacterium]
MNDFVIRGCTVVDPKNNVNKLTSVAIKDGKISEVGDNAKGRRFANFDGAVLMPGIIDTHVHCSNWIGGPASFKMLARAGVTTALDLSGPADVVLDQIAEHGSGINILITEAVYPGVNVKDSNPSYEELNRLLETAISEGAIGFKLLGGHYPLTPEACSAAIKTAADRRCYMAIHAGSVKNGSNMKGALDAIDFAEGRPFHLAHVNSYCRGAVLGRPKEELQTLLKALNEHREVISEFYTARFNGTGGKCAGGLPESHVTRNCLRAGGFPETEAGLKQAFEASFAHCVRENMDGLNEYITGRAALEYWKEMDQNVTCAFPVNDREVAFLCGTSKNEAGEYIIDAVATDGGGIPRNFLLENGLLLVDWGAWSMDDFVRKTSFIPSRMLGLTEKGHLTPGADGDITVFDPVTRRALLTVVGGKVVWGGNALLGGGGTLICLKEGRGAAERRGLPFKTVDLEESMLYKGR